MPISSNNKTFHTLECQAFALAIKYETPIDHMRVNIRFWSYRIAPDEKEYIEKNCTCSVALNRQKEE